MLIALRFEVPRPRALRFCCIEMCLSFLLESFEEEEEEQKK